MAVDSIPLPEFASRRRKLSTSLKGAIGLVFAGDHDAHDLMSTFRPHPHFTYLTGVCEPGAVLMLDPGHPVESRREILYLPPLNREIEKWDGYRLEIGGELRKETGFATIFRTGALARWLREAAIRRKTLACLHPLASHVEPVSPDLAVFQQVQQRIPGIEIIDRTELLAKMRASKSANEVAMIQRAADISAEGYDAVFRELKPGMTEFDVQEMLEHAYRVNGARGPAYSTIAGAGINSTVLHYRDNTQTIEKGDLICIDSGAEYERYAADVTRTIPASGKFTARQREVYDIVLKALRAATKVVKPGVAFAQVDKAARDIINKAGYGEYFIHGIGHHLGLEVHDITPDQPLRIGAVITVEPGIYIPEEKIGIRIEDDVVVTKTGHRVLTSKIPRTAADIEKAMARKRK